MGFSHDIIMVLSLHLLAGVLGTIHSGSTENLLSLFFVFIIIFLLGDKTNITGLPKNPHP
jgi:uncharacterized membrane protein